MKARCENHFGYRDFLQEKAISKMLAKSELLQFSRQARLAKQKDLKCLHEILQLQLAEYISYDLPECGTALWIAFPLKTDLSSTLEILKSQGHRIRCCTVRTKTDQAVNYMRLDFSRFDSRECRLTAIKLRSLLKRQKK